MSLDNKSILKAGKLKNNEFYTTYEHMDALFNYDNNLREVIKDKVIYLPCDTINSKILLYLQKHKEEFQIKDILFTSDDYYLHKDLYDKCDIVFTNPPFTNLHKWLKWLEDKNKKFILFWSWTSVYYKDWFYDKLFNEKYKILTGGLFEKLPYDAPSGDKAAVRCFVFSNINEIKPVYNKERDISKNKSYEELIKSNKTLRFVKNYLYLQNAHYYPKDYYGECLLQPGTVLTYRNQIQVIKKLTKDELKYLGINSMHMYVVKLKR